MRGNVLLPSACFGLAAIVGTVLCPVSTAPPVKAANAVVGFQCVFHSTRGGTLVDGRIVEPDLARSPEVHMTFVVTDPANGTASLRIGSNPGWTVPARFKRDDMVVHFSYEFKDQGAGFVTIAQWDRSQRLPAISTSHGWARRKLSVSYKIGSCVPTDG